LISHFRGLCTILRSEAGGQDNLPASTAPTNDEDDNNDANFAYCNNSHWLPESGVEKNRSNHVAYYDAAALYPASGESNQLKKEAAGRAGG
jgi:hypothetical protein